MRRGSRSPMAAAVRAAAMEVAAKMLTHRPTTSAPSPEDLAQSGTSTDMKAWSSRLVTATIIAIARSNGSLRRKSKPSRSCARYPPGTTSGRPAGPTAVAVRSTAPDRPVPRSSGTFAALVAAGTTTLLAVGDPM